MICGIDPGQKGGIAFLQPDGAPERVLPMPIFDKKIDVQALVMNLDLQAPRLVVIELQSIMGGQRGAMSIGGNYGRIMACVEYLGLPHRIVTPLTWNRHFNIPSGLKGRAKKEAAYAVCRRLWGQAFVDLKIGVSKDGMYESMLIARYGLEKY